MNYYPQAQADEQQAIALLRSLSEQFPTNARYQSLLGIACGGFGWLRMEQGEPQQAQVHVEEAIRRQQAAVAANPQNADYRDRLSEHYAFLAEIHHRQGRPEQAVENLREATAAGPPHFKLAQHAALRDLGPGRDFQQFLAEFQTLDDAANRETGGI
jgi:tetratricopeptide (TPR) repeat protein